MEARTCCAVRIGMSDGKLCVSAEQIFQSLQHRCRDVLLARLPREVLDDVADLRATSSPAGTTTFRRLAATSRTRRPDLQPR